ncbi:acetylglutamate kinase [Selenomonas ruminis]|uniref:acetylglutamate kinase n=1 Tax=Selenomonas ruminis TaxID=2593411 RepID=UPI003F6E606E
MDLFKPEDKAAILVEALPYIQEFYGKTIVIKYGGNAMINDDLKEKVMQDVALMKYVGIRPVIVHGGGPEITGFLKKVGKQSSFVAGLRVTDEETVEIAEMVLDGKVNSEIVNLLNRRGVKAVGLSGKDAGLIQARKKLATVYEGEESKKVDIGYVGEVAAINSGIIEDLLDQDYVPIIAPIGVGENGESYNINADYVAAEIAGALEAEKLLLLTDIEGIYKDFNDKNTFISTLHLPEARQYIKEGIIAGGMIPKVEACLTALEKGAGKTHIIDGRLDHSIILEVFTEQGIGTQVVR